MEIIEKLCVLLEQKKDLFARYEAYTEKLGVCDMERTEDIEEYITNRADLANQIDKLNREITSLCEKAKNRKQLLAWMGNRCNYDEVQPEARGLFSRSQEIFGIMNRIAAQEPQIVQRMRGECDGLLVKIKGAQNTPKIARYLNSLTSKPETGTFLSQQYDKA